MHPHKTCRGKNSKSLPLFKAPKAKKTRPVMTLDRAKAAMTVGVTFSDETSLSMVNTRLCKNGCSSRQAISNIRCQMRCSMLTTTSIIMEPFPALNMLNVEYTSCETIQLIN